MIRGVLQRKYIKRYGGQLTFKPSFNPFKVIETVNESLPLNHLQTCFKPALNWCKYNFCAFRLKIGLKVIWNMI